MKKRILILPLLVFLAWGLGSGFLARKVISIKKPYRSLPPSTEPDYQNKSAWVSRPDFFNPSLWPLNEHKVQSDLKIDVFFNANITVKHGFIIFFSILKLRSRFFIKL